MTIENIGLRAAMKCAIVATTTEITVARAVARTRFAEARTLCAAGDEEGATTARAAAWKAREEADALSPLSRRLHLGYAALRGVPYLALESTRKRAAVPTVEEVLAELVARAETVEQETALRACRAGVKTWLEGPPGAASAAVRWSPFWSRSPAPASAPRVLAGPTQAPELARTGT